MNDIPISVKKLKTAKTWEQLRQRLDELLERGDGNKHIDFVVQSILRQKPPEQFSEYDLLRGDMGQLMYGDRNIGHIGNIADHAAKTTNIAWLTALLKQYPEKTLECINRRSEILKQPKFPRTLLYKIQDALFSQPNLPQRDWAPLYRHGKIFEAMWTSHPRVCSRLTSDHVDMMSRAVSCMAADPTASRNESLLNSMKAASSILCKIKLDEISAASPTHEPPPRVMKM